MANGQSRCYRIRLNFLKNFGFTLLFSTTCVQHNPFPLLLREFGFCITPPPLHKFFLPSALAICHWIPSVVYVNTLHVAVYKAYLLRALAVVGIQRAGEFLILAQNLDP